MLKDLEMLNSMNDLSKVTFGGESDSGKSITELLAEGADPNGVDEEGISPMATAAMIDNLEALKSLMEAGGDPNRMSPEWGTPLHVAALNMSPKCLEYMLKNGGDKDLIHDDCSLLGKLFDMGFLLDGKGKTYLMHPEFGPMVETLLTNGVGILEGELEYLKEIVNKNTGEQIDHLKRHIEKGLLSQEVSQKEIPNKRMRKI